MSETPWVLTVFDGTVLRPYAKLDLDLITARYPPGAQLRARFGQGRSSKHHRLYWGVLAKVVEITELWANPEALHNAVKTQLRMFGSAIHLFNGEVRYELQSIAFDKMDQGAFRVFFDQAMRAIGDSTLVDMDDVIRDVKGDLSWSGEDERKWGGPC